MTGSKSNTGASVHRASRRHFFKMLAGSPLLALAYPALSPSWQKAVDRELQRGRAVGRCPECGAEMFAAQTAGAPAQAPGALDVHLSGQLVESADRAINVWDFEQVAHANNLPEHWAYLHMGVDDFETRKANREGFQRLMLRPRRLGQDVGKLDTSVQLFGPPMEHAAVPLPGRGARGVSHRRRERGGAGRPAREASCRSSRTRARSRTKTIAEARGEPHWFQLYANADWAVNKRTLDNVSKAGCPVLVWTIDLLGGSNRELSRRSLGREGYDRPLCQNCHNHKPDYQRPMHRGVAGPAGPRAPFNWDYVKRLKDATPMKVVLKGIVTREEAELAVENGADGVFVSNHGGRAENSLRGTIDSLPEVVAGVKGRAAGVHRQRRPPRRRHLQGAGARRRRGRHRHGRTCGALARSVSRAWTR